MVKSKKNTVGDFPNFHSLYKIDFCQKKNDVFDYLNNFCNMRQYKREFDLKIALFTRDEVKKKYWQQNPSRKW